MTVARTHLRASSDEQIHTHTARAQHGEIVLLPVGSDSVMVRLVTVAQAQSHVAKH